MSMSTHAVGFRPPDDKWKRMKAVYETCQAAEIDIPAEAEEYFNHEPPGDSPGMEVALGASCEEYKGEYSDGYQIDISKLPDGVKFIRVYNSY